MKLAKLSWRNGRSREIDGSEENLNGLKKDTEKSGGKSNGEDKREKHLIDGRKKHRNREKCIGRTNNSQISVLLFYSKWLYLEEKMPDNGRWGLRGGNKQELQV